MSDGTREERVDALFARARALPAAERDAFLASECADAELRAEVRSLLDEAVDGFMEWQEDAEREDTDAPRTIGAYRIERVLGRGGMGVVYLAAQEEPVRRQVALKVIRRGLVTREILARFRSEEQALALMSHSSIARVFDAGLTHDGTPWFAMEYVDGLPLVEHCERGRLPLAERLRLFTLVCEGVRHAHQKGIIHRDLKSANVLVAQENGRAVPKIIDFGIAKALGPPLTAETLATEVGQVVGTLDCMSPEQLDWRGQDVDTRADVYALGVLLYELLTGRRPFDVAALRKAAFDEALRVLREVVPPPPSARVDPAAARALSGDLDWIVLRALEKDRERRYPGVAELADDVRRHLANEPVLARPPGRIYRAQRFVRRNRLAVALTAVAVLALLGGMAATTVQTLRARRAERLAEAKAAEARSEADTSAKVTESLVKMFRPTKPAGEGGENDGETAALREILDRQAADVRDSLSDDPGLQGRVMRTMGKAYTYLGFYRKAIEMLEESLPLLERSSAPGDPVIYDALNELGNNCVQVGLWREARAYFGRALALARAARPVDRSAVAVILRNLGDACVKAGDLAAARPAFEEALLIQTELFGESAAVAKTLSSLSALELESGRPEVAVTLAERSLRIRVAAYGEGHVAVAAGRFLLAEAEFGAGRFGRARDDFAAVLPVWEKAFGAGHANVGECLFGLARAHARLGDRAAAYDAVRRARAAMEHAFDPSDPRVAGILAEWLDKFAGLLRDIGHAEEAASTAAAAAKVHPRTVHP